MRWKFPLRSNAGKQVFVISMQDLGKGCGGTQDRHRARPMWFATNPVHEPIVDGLARPVLHGRITPKQAPTDREDDFADRIHAEPLQQRIAAQAGASAPRITRSDD